MFCGHDMSTVRDWATIFVGYLSPSSFLNFKRDRVVARDVVAFDPATAYSCATWGLLSQYQYWLSLPLLLVLSQLPLSWECSLKLPVGTLAYLAYLLVLSLPLPPQIFPNHWQQAGAPCVWPLQLQTSKYTNKHLSTLFNLIGIVYITIMLFLSTLSTLLSVLYCTL